MIEQYKESIRTLIECAHDSVHRILKGEVSFLKSECLTIEQRIELFKAFIAIVHEKYDDGANYEIINHAVIIFLKLFKSGLLVRRRDDLSSSDCKKLLVVVNSINKKMMIDDGYSDSEIEGLLKFINQTNTLSRFGDMFSNGVPNNSTARRRRQDGR